MSSTTFEELKTKYQSRLPKDEEVNCRLLVKLKDGYLIDVNNEWEGFVPKSHITNQIEVENSVFEPFKALIISGPDKSDRYMVSPKALREKSIWKMLELYKQDNQVVKVRIAKAIKGGAEVYIDTLRAFLPGRYIRLPGLSPDNWVNQEIDVLIEELDQKDKKIILNQKKAIDQERQRKSELAIYNLKEGDIVEATVLRIADFGVFVDLGGLDGLVPASELSWGRFSHPKDVVSIGQTVRARIFRIEKNNLRVACSIKQLLGDPWEHIEHELSLGSIVEGKVINESSFGLFVELKPGVESLLHNSEMNENTERPKVDSTITAKVIKIDLEQRRIGLSTREIPSPLNVPALPEESEAGLECTIADKETPDNSSEQERII